MVSGVDLEQSEQSEPKDIHEAGKQQKKKNKGWWALVIPKHVYAINLWCRQLFGCVMGGKQACNKHRKSQTLKHMFFN